MATGRIESGQISLRGAGGVPMQQISMQQADISQQYRVEAQGANALSQLVDRMGQSAMRMAGEFFKEQAVIDVANNPLTPEQLELAKNGDMSFLAGGSRLNLYDATVRKARSMELSSAFDTEAKAEVVKIQSDVEAGTLTSEQAAQKLNNISAGFARSLAQVDADAALRFTASMGVYAKTVMAEAYKLETKRRKEKEGVLLEADYNNTMKLVEPAIGQGFLIDAEGQEIPIDSVLAVHRKNFVDKAFNVGGLQMAQSMGQRFDKAVAEAKVNAATKLALGDEYMADPEVGLQKLRMGDLGRMSGVFANLPQDDKSKVIANFMVAVNQRETLAKQKQAENKRAGEIQLANLMQQYYAAPPGSPAQRAAQSGMVTLAQTIPGVVSDSTLKSILEPKQAKSDPMVEFNVVSGILNGTITTADQVKGYIGRGLTGNDAVSALKLINSENRRDESEIQRGINRLAGINQTGGIVVLDKNAMEFTNRQLLQAQALDIQARMVREGKQPTPAMVIGELEKFVGDRRNSETAKQAIDALKVYEKKDWINGPVTMDSLPALERKAGNDRTRQNDVKRIRSLLQQANGIGQ